jgi:V8-like Glu-specific endopeptidase
LGQLILNPSGKIVGTGFLASDNLVVTCAHVVVAANAIDGDIVQVNFDGGRKK